MCTGLHRDPVRESIQLPYVRSRRENFEASFLLLPFVEQNAEAEFISGDAFPQLGRDFICN
jgi:hypothetical protein